MNVLVAKEIRLLLPAYVAALLLAIIPVWLISDFSVVMLVFLLGMVILALSSFGMEFGLKTFPLMLALPLERRRVWRTKLALLGCAVATIVPVWVLSQATRALYGNLPMSSPHDLSGLLEMLLLGVVFALVIIPSGWFWSITLRQIAAAFWFTMLIPVAIEVFHQFSETPLWLEYLLVAAYSLVAFGLARWQFFNAQEAGWAGGAIALPGLRLAGRTRPARRSPRPLTALLLKEIQLHQLTLAVMAVLFLIHLGLASLPKNGSVHAFTFRWGLLQFFWGVWLFVPLVGAGSSVAEERKLGTWQGGLCLPVGRPLQFLIKLFFCLLVFGAGSAVLDFVANGGLGPVFMMGQFLVCLAFLVLTLVCFYASTLVGGLIQSWGALFLVLAILGSVVWNLMWLSEAVESLFGFPLFNGFLLFLTGVPVAVVTVVYLAYVNFKNVSEGWQLWRRNLRTFVMVVVSLTLALTLFYNRVWEFMTPAEPSIGPAQFTAPKLPVIVSSGTSLWPRSVFLPDGRVWIGSALHWRHDFPQGDDGPPTGSFLPGSNWVATVNIMSEIAALRADGTLWSSQDPGRAWSIQNGRPVYGGPRPFPLIQYGTDTNWCALARTWWDMAGGILLKRDGTLWHWGPTTDQGRKFIVAGVAWPGLRAYAPRQLGTNSDWVRIIPGDTCCYVWQANGAAWAVQARPEGLPDFGRDLEPGINSYRVWALDGLELNTIVSCGMTDHPGFEAGLDKKGRLLLFLNNTDPPALLTTNNDWTSIAANGELLVARKADGTLWQWRFRGAYKSLEELANVAPSSLGRQHHWVAVCGPGIVSLASDGSLWRWPIPDSDSRYYLVPRNAIGNAWRWPGPYADAYYLFWPPVMRPSRKLAYLGNVFDPGK